MGAFVGTKPLHAAPWSVGLCVGLALAGCANGALDASAVDMATPPSPPDMLCTKTLCGARCVDVQTDSLDCGACGNACPSGQICRNSACIAKPCAVDGDCDDGIACTVDQCVSSVCQHTAGPDSGATVCGSNMTCDVRKGCVPVPPLFGPNLCAQDPPNGATLAPAPPKYKGTCPMIVPATKGETLITSSGNPRTFMVAIPANLDPKEKLPVLFLWHWLGGSDNSFYKTGDVQSAVDQQRFLAVIAENKHVNGNSDLAFRWPFDVADSQARIDEELQYFDDMYACVAQQFNINKECVSTAGVSAGALWTDQLVQLRNEVFSSGISLSGGTGGLIRPWSHPPRHIPMTVLWGGPNDFCIAINFQDASHDLEMGLAADGAFTLECVHNCGHGVPPITPPMGVSMFAPIWQFALDHPYWLPPGTSPYQMTGLPLEYPTWCAIDAGNAVPRTGMCPPPGC